jgi:hypothetical protein
MSDQPATGKTPQNRTDDDEDTDATGPTPQGRTDQEDDKAEEGRPGGDV